MIKSKILTILLDSQLKKKKTFMHKKFLATSIALVTSSVAALPLISNSAGAMNEELEKYEVRFRTPTYFSQSDIHIDNGTNKSAKWRNNGKDIYSCHSGQYTHITQVCPTSAKASYVEIQADNGGAVIISRRSKRYTIFELLLPPRQKGCINFIPERRNKKVSMTPLKLSYPQGIKDLVDIKTKYLLERDAYDELLENDMVVQVYKGWSRDK